MVVKQIRDNRVLVTWNSPPNPVMNYRIFVDDEDINAKGRVSTLPSYVLDSIEFDKRVTIRVRAQSVHYWSEVLGPKSIIIGRK